MLTVSACFILQKSNRIGIMAEAVKSYILNYLRDGTAVGIVSFNAGSQLLANMTDITSTTVRDELASKVPTTTALKTAIADGLQTCQQVSKHFSFFVYEMFCNGFETKAWFTECRLHTSNFNLSLRLLSGATLHSKRNFSIAYI